MSLGRIFPKLTYFPKEALVYIVRYNTCFCEHSPTGDQLAEKFEFSKYA